MRNVAIYKNPVAEPGCCSKCGSQNRKWYIDLGFDAEMFKPVEIPMADETVQVNAMWMDGILYLCNECFDNLIKDVERELPYFKVTHDIEDEEVENVRTESSVGSDPGTDENNLNPESDNPEPIGETPTEPTYWEPSSSFFFGGVGR